MEFSYDIGLASLSIAISVLSAFTGLVLTTRLGSARNSEASIRIALAGMALGGGVWATHGVATSAMMAPIAFSDGPGLSALSAMVAALFAFAALSVVGNDLLGRYTQPAATVFLGSGFTAIHYLGLAGLNGGGQILLWWPAVAGSILCALEAAAIALWFAFRERGIGETVLASLAVGLAGASMHFLGMEAVILPQAADPAAIAHGVTPNGELGLSIAAGVYSLCGVSLLIFCAFAVKGPISRGVARPLGLQLTD